MDTIRYDVVVVGSGAAGLCCGARLAEMGKSVAIVTENMSFGTSRNAGSDKQTYYKLSLGGGDADSVALMADNLFSFGSVDGDNALCEAALSARCFLALAEGGVPFPHNKYGEYVGYKTDHDPYKRATSAGPLTSKYMTELWEHRVTRLNIPIYDGYRAVELLTDDGKLCGLSAINISTGERLYIQAPCVVLAVGGPAGIYADSVYPLSQTGGMSLAVKAGALLQNLTEWQYGLASVAPRWNVSGSYMQVLPRFISVDGQGNTYDFLGDYFNDSYEAMSKVFLKGYQWPFDSNKVLDGSSVIDLLVYRERVIRGRRVYLDFTVNPFGLESIAFDRLSDDAYTYLENADALLPKPIDRLERLNPQAVELYRSKGVDLTREPLEIALCVQHHNGGIAVNEWWMSSVRGLFAVGECAGTHGISRPGGSALNAGQVGALRAAEYISRNGFSVGESEYAKALEASLRRQSAFDKLVSNADNVCGHIDCARRKMSDMGGAIRDSQKIKKYLCEVENKLEGFFSDVAVASCNRLRLAYQYRDILETQRAVLSAMLDYAERGYSSRGSAIICDGKGVLPQGLDECFRFRMSESRASHKIQTAVENNGKIQINLRDVRPIPKTDDFFEKVWQEFRENKY